MVLGRLSGVAPYTQILSRYRFLRARGPDHIRYVLLRGASRGPEDRSHCEPEAEAKLLACCLFPREDTGGHAGGGSTTDGSYRTDRGYGRLRVGTHALAF